MTEARKIGPLTIRPEVIKCKKTGLWFLDIPGSLTNDGKRKRPRYPSRTVAENMARELKRSLELRKLGYVQAAPQKAGLPFRDAVTHWEEALELEVMTGGFRALTLRTYRSRIKALQAYFGGRDVSAIDPTEIKRYQAHRLAAGRKAVSINGELRVLRQLLGWLVDRGELAALPKVPKLAEDRRFLAVPTVEEVVRLVDHLRGSAKVLVWLMAETGLRPDEARNLPWSHVDAENGAILVQPFGNWRPKTASSVRRVYPSEHLMRELMRLPRKGDYVFPGTDPAKPVQNVRTALQTAAKRAGLSRNGKPFVPTVKLFRKAFATTLAERGINQSVVGAMMGHAPGSKMTDQFYTFIRDEAKRANRLSLRDAASAGVA